MRVRCSNAWKRRRRRSRSGDCDGIIKLLLVQLSYGILPSPDAPLRLMSSISLTKSSKFRFMLVPASLVVLTTFILAKNGAAPDKSFIILLLCYIHGAQPHLRGRNLDAASLLWWCANTRHWLSLSPFCFTKYSYQSPTSCVWPAASGLYTKITPCASCMIAGQQLSNLHTCHRAHAAKANKVCSGNAKGASAISQLIRSVLCILVISGAVPHFQLHGLCAKCLLEFKDPVASSHPLSCCEFFPLHSTFIFFMK